MGVALFALCACNRDDIDTTANRSADVRNVVPHFYGWMTVDDPAPETRGVANALKVWSKPVAKNHLTVKFLNGTANYRQFVETVAREWEKYADVRFRFVPDDQDAVVRIGFDYVKGMSSSWALTGTDHMQRYGNQDEATVHFAQWRRASDEAKRSDVLRAFGQVLGLELEFRHPDFNPQWITDDAGNIDEPAIREYWEYELNELITWEELRKVVLEPLSNQTFMIEKTKEYDPNSVMSWPFFEMIARNIPPIEFDEDYKTELSASDKEFIQQLYGEQTGTEPVDYVKLVTFDHKGFTAEITLTTTKDLIVKWSDNTETRIDVPADTTTLFTTTVSHKFDDAKTTHNIIVGELVPYGQDRPTSSYALKKFDLNSGYCMENLNIEPEAVNTNLSYIRIQGGSRFKTQQLSFVDNKYLKELYLTEIGDSKVTIDNCSNLEVFATSNNIWMLNLDALGVNGTNGAQGVQLLSGDEEPNDDMVISGLSLKLRYPIQLDPDVPIFIRPWHPIENTPIAMPVELFSPWPCDPQQNYALSDGADGKGLSIKNCPKLRMISLENTRIKTLNLISFKDLEYLYLSSTSEYIVNSNLLASLSSLHNRTQKTPGQIIIRGIKINTTGTIAYYKYSPVEFPTSAINNLVISRNWAICWDPTFEWDTSEN